MSAIGVLFDIDELGGGLYGYAAYKIFFAAVDTSELAACLVSDGDTNATLTGRARQYCIRVDLLLDDSKIGYVRNALSACSAKGLLPLSSRFLPDSAASREPLVLAGRIDAVGKLVDCKTGWVREAWEKSREQHAASRSNAGQARSAPAVGVSHPSPEIVRCSKCRAQIKRLNVGLAESVPGLQQWLGNVCVPCARVYCSKCMQLGGPTPCPVCGQPTKPAQRMFLEAVGALNQASSLPAAGISMGTDATQTITLDRASVAPAKPSKPSMPKRERSIGIIFLIAALAFFEIGIQGIGTAKQPPPAAMAAMQISMVLGFIGSGYVAAKRGRSKAWALLGILNWLGIIIAFLLPNRSAKSAVEKTPVAVAPPPKVTVKTPKPPKPPAAPTSQGIATLLKVCSEQRYRLGILDDEPSFNQAVEELKRDGVAGATALGALIDQLLAARCAEIQDALQAASRLSPHAELVSAIRRVISAPPVIAGSQAGPFSPIIFGGGKIGWDDPSAARIRKQASEVLRMLGVAAEAAVTKPAITPVPKEVIVPSVAESTPTVLPTPAPQEFQLPPIGLEFLASKFTPAEEPAGRGVGAFWEGIQCCNRHENDRAEAAFKEAALKGVPPTCESYVNCELGKLALAKGQLARGVDYLLRSLTAEKKSENVALDAALRLQVIYAEAGRSVEANTLAKLVASANTRGLALTSKAEEELRELVRKRHLTPDSC